MSYQKLKFSKKEPNSYIYFCFYAGKFDANQITADLKFEPRLTQNIKTEFNDKSTSWKYKIDAGKELDIEKYIEALIDILEPRIEVINQIKKELKLETILQLVIDIDINPDISIPYFGLSKRTIKFLGQTRTEVDFDLYKVDITER